MPLFGQIAVTCTAPTAKLSWPADPEHPVLYARVQPGTQVLGYLDAIKAGMQQRGPISGAGNVSFSASTGSYVAYLLQDSPYWQGPALTFTCAPAAPTPTPQNSAGITVVLDGKTVGTFGVLKLVTGANVNFAVTDNNDGSVTIQVSAPTTTAGQ